MSGLRNKAKGESFDECYRCIVCGKGDRGRDTLEGIQAGGHWTEHIWAHGHCEAEVHVEFAVKSLDEARQRLHQVKFDARGAVKCLEQAMRELGTAKDCLIGKALWPNLC